MNILKGKSDGPSHGKLPLRQVQYVLTGEPTSVAVCHCTHCQKQTASAFSIVVMAPRKALEITGDLKAYKDTGDSGQTVLRQFCPNCGSPVLTEAAVMPEVAIIKAGTFNDTGWLRPAFNMFRDSAQPWLDLPEDIPNFGRMPANAG
jgi:hypothetical protein